MILTLNGKAYVTHRTDGSKTVLHGPDHTDLSKDLLVISAPDVKRRADSYGNRKVVLTMIRSLTVATPDGETAVKDQRVRIESSIPVGYTSDAEKDCLQNAADILAVQSVSNHILVQGSFADFTQA
jgi:hypothetical protein